MTKKSKQMKPSKDETNKRQLCCFHFLPKLFFPQVFSISVNAINHMPSCSSSKPRGHSQFLSYLSIGKFCCPIPVIFIKLPLHLHCYQSNLRHLDYCNTLPTSHLLPILFLFNLCIKSSQLLLKTELSSDFPFHLRWNSNS